MSQSRLPLYVLLMQEEMFMNKRTKHDIFVINLLHITLKLDLTYSFGHTVKLKILFFVKYMSLMSIFIFFLI